MNQVFNHNSLLQVSLKVPFFVLVPMVFSCLKLYLFNGLLWSFNLADFLASAYTSQIKYNGQIKKTQHLKTSFNEPYNSFRTVGEKTHPNNNFEYTVSFFIQI